VLDMREEIAARRFDPAKDSVGVRSGVEPLTWHTTLPASDADRDGRYEVTVTFPRRPFGGQPVNYKFKVDTASNPEGRWEEGRNRRLFLEAPAQTVSRRFNEPPPAIEPVLTGNIRKHPAFASRYLGPRNLIVYLPPGYERETSRRYPVLYMHDGQNIFDASAAGMEWQMDEQAEALISAGTIEPVIIVGVANTAARTDEYTPTRIEEKGPDGSVVWSGGGKADLYGRLLIEEVKPFIDRTYRTLPGPESTALGGASFGGLVSLHLGLAHPQVFGKLLAVSPAVRWDDSVILETIAALPAKTGQRIWVDMGTAEEDHAIPAARRLRDALIAKGWVFGSDLAYLEQDGGGHDEIAWASRVEPMLRFLFGTRRYPVIPGPEATRELVNEITEEDRRLFDLVFIRCDADALAAMLDADFAFFHDKFGQIAASPQQFVTNVRQGCEAQAKGVNVRARRELVPGTMEVYPLQGYGAIQTGSHRFFGVEPGKPDQLRETGKFFNVWKRVDGRWKLSRVYSFDHQPAQ
jgi:predicted alpha/beta superfamily hydrolase